MDIANISNRLTGPQIATRYCVKKEQRSRNQQEENSLRRTIVHTTNFDRRFLDFVCDGEVYVLTNCGSYYSALVNFMKCDLLRTCVAIEKSNHQYTLTDK